MSPPEMPNTTSSASTTTTNNTTTPAAIFVPSDWAVFVETRSILPQVVAVPVTGNVMHGHFAVVVQLGMQYVYKHGNVFHTDAGSFYAGCMFDSATHTFFYTGGYPYNQLRWLLENYDHEENRPKYTEVKLYFMPPSPRPQSIVVLPRSMNSRTPLRHNSDDFDFKAIKCPKPCIICDGPRRGSL